MRKKKKLLLITGVFFACLAVLYLYSTSDKGNAGIYDLDGNILVSYNKLHKWYGYDVTKNCEIDSANSLPKILDRLGIEEDVTFVLPEADRIGEYALSFADNLVYCELPDSLETIGAHAFYSSGLHKITILKNVTEIDHNAFDSCRNMSSIVLNDGLKYIGVSAFRYEPNLTDVVIPDSVRFIGNCAFQNTGLEYVLVPCDVEDIGEYAFENTGTVCYSGLAWTYDGFGAKDFHRFSDCNTCDLCGVTLEYVPYIIESAEFVKDDTCNIPEIFERDGIRYKVVSIGQGAYKGNTELRNINIPDSVVSIQDEAFADCTNLEHISLNDCLSELGNNVFCNCSSLEEILISDNVRTISGCFSGCTNLKEIYLPNQISLSTMDFEGCDNLRTVYYKGTEEEWNSKTVGAPAPVMSVPIDTLFEENVKIVCQLLGNKLPSMKE